MKPSVTFIAMLLISCICNGRFNYKYSVKYEAWQPLLNPVSINKGLTWDEEGFKFPLGFSFVLDGAKIDTVGLAGPTFIATDTIGNLRGFYTLDADFCDRGLFTGSTSLSPIQYEVTGTAGSRICKIEFLNMGFWDEDYLFGTSDDSVDLQVWLYEADNSVEFHYGPSKVTHPSDYFLFCGQPAAGLFRLNNDNTSIDTAYYLVGDPENPGFDSIINQGALPTGLDSIPAAGTVYRFEPLTTGIENTTATTANVEVYPTIASDMLTVRNTSNRQLHYVIYTLDGKQLQTKGTVAQGKHEIDVSSLPKGTFMLQLACPSSRHSFKFIKL